ncbi:MAG: hypothetical protein DI539_31420, partial [Flavobacterium psychrophilum]
LAGTAGIEAEGTGGDGMHTLPGYEPVVAIRFGHADLAALAVEAQGRCQWFAPLFDKQIPERAHQGTK